MKKPTPEQWTEKYVKIALATEDFSKSYEDISTHIKALYKFAGLGVPAIALVNSPTQAQAVAGLSSLILDGMPSTLALPASMYSGDWEVVEAICSITGIALPPKPRISKKKIDFFSTCRVQSAGLAALSKYFGLGNDGMEACRAARGGLRIGSNAAGDHAALAFEAQFEPVKGEDYTRFNHYAWVQENTGGLIYGEKVCAVFRRPTFINVIFEAGQAQPHYEHGSYIQYGGDDCGVYALEGVFVAGWIVLSTPESMNADDVLAIENADQRALAMKKMGYARLKDAMKVQVIHTGEDGYELWTMEVEGRRVGPYLKMVNPTTGITHVEGVPSQSEFSGKDIETCEDALAWRAGRKTYRKPAWVA